MIAVCPRCHGFCDGQNYTIEQLKELKFNPPDDPPRGSLPWRPTKVLVIFGGNYFLANKDSLFAFRVDSREVFAFSLMENGYLAISAEIYTPSNELICRIDQNDILPNMEEVGDLMCSVQGKEISVSGYNQVRLKLRFSREAKAKLLAIAADWPKTLSDELRPGKTDVVNDYIDKCLDGEGMCPTIEISAECIFSKCANHDTQKSYCRQFSEPGSGKGKN
jgi:hypothetical protein